MGRKKLPFVLGSEWLQGGGEGRVADGLEGGERAAGGWEPRGAGEGGGHSFLPWPGSPEPWPRGPCPQGGSCRGGLRSWRSDHAPTWLIQGKSGRRKICPWDPWDPSYLPRLLSALAPTSAPCSCPTDLLVLPQRPLGLCPGSSPSHTALSQIPARCSPFLRAGCQRGLPRALLVKQQRLCAQATHYHPYPALLLF